MTVRETLTHAAAKLATASVLTPRLDAQVLLGHVLGAEKSWLLAHPDDTITLVHQKKFFDLVQKRLKRMPVAQLTSTQEFYGRQFTVNQDVLIPRPETEALIDLIRTREPLPKDTLLDVGTGSGIIAITAKLEWPQLGVSAVDISPQALVVACQNAVRLGADINFATSDLLQHATGQYHYIVANLPYVDPAWARSPETNAEPALALFANDQGLALIKQFLRQVPAHLVPHGYVVIEADPRQHNSIAHFAQKENMRLIATSGFGMLFSR